MHAVKGRNDGLGAYKQSLFLNNLANRSVPSRSFIVSAFELKRFRPTIPPSRFWRDFAVDRRPYRDERQYSKQAVAAECSGRWVLKNGRLWVWSTCRRTRS